MMLLVGIIPLFPNVCCEMCVSISLCLEIKNLLGSFAYVDTLIALIIMGCCSRVAWVGSHISHDVDVHMGRWGAYACMLLLLLLREGMCCFYFEME